METINEKIKRIRIEAGINQADVARAAGIKQSSYASIEKGDTKSISIEVGKGIAKALGISFNELFEVEILQNDSLINELKAENERLKEQLNLTNQQSVLKDKLISGYEKQIEDAKHYSMYWPRVLILSTAVEFNDELKKGEITKEQFDENLKLLFSVSALAYLFSIEFDNKLVNELEEYLMSRNEKNSVFYSKTFIEFVRKTQDKYKNLKGLHDSSDHTPD